MILKKIALSLVVLFVAGTVYGHLPADYKKKKVNNLIQQRNDCAPAEQSTNLDVNNVRARLRIGGDLWWDGQGQGNYIVPKPAPGFAGVSAIFSGGVWLGGVDPAGNLKAAITQYPSGNVTDFWAGPLDEKGETSASVCNDWDRFFEVSGENIRKQISAWDNSPDALNADEIPDDVKYWPGRGNPFWAQRFDFDLPDQNLGAFWDQPGGKAGVYDPTEGDFPLINIRDCEPATRLAAAELVPDQMIFWIYNDAGNDHLETGADKIQMEIQVQAFAYATNDEVNDMTFYRYKLINKSIDDIQDCYFAMWTDPDLGCYLDDYIGCDVERSLAYVYNEDALDGTVGDACPGGVETYGANIPILGIDYFRGPRGPKLFLRDENGEIVFNAEGDTVLVDPVAGTGELDTLVELGMSSFVYTNSGANNEPPGTTDPNNGQQAYNVLRGLWPDGTPVTFGGQIEGNSGYNPGSTDSVKYVFPAAPNDGTGWSMCEADLPFGDRRTIQATGPILLQAGGLPEELIVGAVFVPSIQYPCPDITRLQFADDIAQSLFNNCFDITDGPEAPDMCGVELDRQLILLLSNDSLISNSNNALLGYEESDLQAPEEYLGEALSENEKKYRFEGYKLYQLKNPAVSVQELDDPEKAQLIRQVDIKNGVSSIYNWYPKANPVESGKLEYNSNQEVNGADEGISSTFNILNDAFDSGGGRLVNHTDYYFTVVAYAYNNFGDWLNAEQVGQRRPYLEGRSNVRTYTFTPRPQVYQTLNSAYGQEADVTRIEGVGTGLTALDLIDGEHEAILDETAEGIITYKAGSAPISVKIVDPLNIQDARYRLEIFGDHNDDANEFNEGAKWRLTNLDSGKELVSEVTIDVANEQIAYGEGFSVSVLQSSEPGNEVDNNGAIDQTLEYADVNGPQWYLGSDATNGFTITDGVGGIQVGSLFSYAQSDPVRDPNGQLTTFGTGQFTPLPLTLWDGNGTPDAAYVSPNWRNQFPIAEQNGFIDIEALNNVDIVMTSDKSKWSRCIVVETGTSFYTDNGLSTEGDATQLSLRRHNSVDQEGVDDGDGEGMGWFPGYAIDVETGERLNIFFGENSGFNDERSILATGDISFGIGDDMIFNPNSSIFENFTNDQLPFVYNQVFGGHHAIYVTRTEYDECAILRNIYTSPDIFPIFKPAALLGSVTYATQAVTSLPMLSPADGLIPNDVTFKVRVTNEFKKEIDFSFNDESTPGIILTSVGETPVYEFEFSGVQATDKVREDGESPLADVAVVPNPYYAYSAYETSQFDNSVKVTNLPARATVSIYSLDGKFIRQYIRNETPMVKQGSNPALTEGQIYPALEWDLNNESGIPVASGVYIFHIVAPDLNAERSIKWFGVSRKFDPTGL